MNSRQASAGQVIGIDLGATNIRGTSVHPDGHGAVLSWPINAKGSMEEVLATVTDMADRLAGPDTRGIGIGVPSVVDVDKGIVYDVQNIPSWKEVPLKAIMEERYGVPVQVNNDANCFALGEKYFGQGRDSKAFIGLTLGTGLGAGIILNDKLYAGPNCGAGEFGMVPYLDYHYEYYASGQFFTLLHHTDGREVYRQACEGREVALALFREFGTHLGNAIKMVLYALDPDRIVIGGSIREAYPFFQETMWERIRTFAYPKSVERLRILLSELEHAGVLGAAALCYDAARP